MSPESLVARRERGLLCASKRFGRYKPDSEKAVRQQESRPGAVGSLLRAFSELRTELEGGHNPARGFPEGGRQGIYEACLGLAARLEYRPSDILGFSATVRAEDNSTDGPALGVFLSALIDRSEEERFHLVFGDACPLFLAMHNRKSVVVEGDVGNWAGFRMRGGLLEIRGDADRYLGSEMGGGTIIVLGNAAEGIGEHSSGGRISIAGDMGGPGGSCGAGIYHRGKPVTEG